MEHADGIRDGSGKVAVSMPVSGTNRLSVAGEVRREPGRVDGVGLELGKELRVVDHIEAFG